MKLRRPVLTSIAFVACTALFAQMATLPGGSGETLGQQYPGPLQDAVFRQIVAGELTGDDHLDAVVMDDDVPTLLVTPEAFDTAVPVLRNGNPISVNDIAMLVDGGDGTDALLTVGADGLESWTRESKTWVSDAIVSGSPWEDAVLVRTGNIDGVGGDDDIVGVGLSDDAPTEVLTLVKDGSSYSSGGFSTAGEVYDLFLLDWDEDGEGGDTTDEIALLTDIGVEVYEPDGTPLDLFSWTTSTIVAAVVDHKASNAERLAMVTDPGGTNHVLSVFSHAGVEGPYAIGKPKAVRATSADMDADGDRELILSIRKDTRIWVVDNRSTGDTSPTFDPEEIYKPSFGYPRSAQVNDAGIVAGDFDNDGDLDLLAPAQGSNGVHSEAHVYRWTTIDETDFRPDIPNTSDWDAGSDTLTIDLEYSPEGLPGVSSGNFGFEVTLWYSPTMAAGPSLEPHAAFITQQTTYSMDVPGTYDPNTSNEVYSVVARQVLLDTDDETVLQRGPARTVLIAPINLWETVLAAPEIENKYPGGTPTGNDPTGVGQGPRGPGYEEGEDPSRGEEEGGGSGS